MISKNGIIVQSKNDIKYRMVKTYTRLISEEASRLMHSRRRVRACGNLRVKRSPPRLASLRASSICDGPFELVMRELVKIASLYHDYGVAITIVRLGDGAIDQPNKVDS
jgi:hypothetical protein